MSVSAGTLALAGTTGLAGSGDDSSVLHYQGDVAALDMAIEGLSFTPPLGFEGNIVLSVLAQSTGAVPLEESVMITSGVLVVSDANDAGPGSLRQAIIDSNAAVGGTNTIIFAIPGTGVHSIALGSPLPAIINPVILDGTSQKGYAGTPLVVLDASALADADALSITGGSCYRLRNHEPGVCR